MLDPLFSFYMCMSSATLCYSAFGLLFLNSEKQVIWYLNIHSALCFSIGNFKLKH